MPQQQDAKGVTDENGQITLENLIPGAIYTLRIADRMGVKFRAEPSETDRSVDIIFPQSAAEPLEQMVAQSDGWDESATVQQTIRYLQADGETEAAEYLAGRLKYALDRHRKLPDWRFIFGRIVVKDSDNPRYCDA